MAYSSIKVYGSSGFSGASGSAGASGFSGFGGPGYSGYSGTSGYSGYSGKSGYSGYSGIGQWALSFDAGIAAGQTATVNDIGGDTKSYGTMECWFRTSSSSYAGTVIGSFFGSGDSVGIEITITGKTSLGVNWEGNHSLSVTQVYADGQWHHLAVTWSLVGDYVKLWFDGKNIATASMVVTYITLSQGFKISSFNTFDINEVLLSINTIKYTSSFTPPRGFFTVDGFTRGYWPVNEGSGTIVRDYSGNGYDLTIGSYGALPTWIQALNRQTGYSGVSGYSGYGGSTGSSGYSGYSGSGVSGYSGYSGTSGKSGYSGYSGYSGSSGYSGYSGSGVSGYSGYSGYSGTSGYSGYSGYSGSGYSGYSGVSGSGISGYSAYSGTSGTSGNTAGEFSGLIETPTSNKTYTLITKIPYNTRLLSFVGQTGSGYLYADLYDDGAAITGYSGKYMGNAAVSGYSGTPYTIASGSKVTMMISGFSVSPSPYDFGFTLGFDQEGV